MIKVNRCSNNPLITIFDVKPTREDFKVDGIFNCGVCRYNKEVILACRVAESVKCSDDKTVKIPIVKKENELDKIDVISINKDKHPEWDFSDSRSVKTKSLNTTQRIISLTSLSHIRLARSKDGIHFKLDKKPFVIPNAAQESWGMEDPRITKIDDTYYINYTAVNQFGPSTALISTKDFSSYTRHGIIFVLENKDVCIFPKKIGNMYYALNRPSSEIFGTPNIWISESPDLVHWGNQKHFCSSEQKWENGRIGSGAPPILTDKGWLLIYHAADINNRYCLGAMLLDSENPEKIISRTVNPIMYPETDYENNGFFDGVIFTCGCLLENKNLIIYYGAADDKICRADIPLSDIYRALGI